MLGKALGKYRVESKLGSGGMGVVYQGTDTRLGRTVAIKVLHVSIVQDAERMARFEREARVLASLNHTNIAAIHGIEESEGTKFLVLEYVPGDTLDERLARSPVPTKEALEICRQIAEGLDAAHEKGIIHRDLKPANIKITPEGKVKVLDFGLAKTAEGPSSSDTQGRTATFAAEMTQAGTIMGTTAYMSPEQACGKPVDRRTDIWAFGCVLYETLTRKATFAGDFPTEVLAAILDKDPDWKALPAAVPENVKLLLRRCLEKDRRLRLRDIGDARLELEETLAGRITAPIAAVPPRARTRRMLAGALGGLAILGLAVGIGSWLRSRRVPAPAIVRFIHPLPAGHQMTPGWNPSLVFSPDGETLAFDYEVDGITTAFQRPIRELDQKPLGGVKSLGSPVYSPDGRWVVMVDTMDQTLKKIAVDGGAPVPLTETDMFGRGDWGKDGYIYFTERYPGAIQRIPENGGPKEAVSALDLKKNEFTHRHAQILPGGKAIVFTVVDAGMESYNDARIELQVLGTQERKILVQGGFGPRYSPSGHIVYAKAGNLYAFPFDLGKLEPTGLPVKVVEGVQMSTNTGAAYFDVSSTDALAYVPGVAEGGTRALVWVDRQGKTDALPLPPRSYLFPRISPDGKTIAVEVEGATHNLYSWDITRAVLTKLTTDGLSHAPVWMPDGKNICFRSWKSGTMTMWSIPSDQSGTEKRLTMVGARQSAVSVSGDGKWLAYNQMGEMLSGQSMEEMDAGSGIEPRGTGSDIWILPLQGDDRRPRPFANKKFDEASPKFSSDGKLVAYCSNEEGQPEVYVQPWPGPGWKIKLSSEGGTDPLFCRGDREIVYRNGDKTMVVPIKTAGGFEAGKPTLLWAGHFSHGMSSSCGPPGVSSANYDVTADGQRFLMIKDNDQDVVSKKIIVVLNWTAALRKDFRERP